MIFCNIASGSSGNCTYIGTDSAHILVDAGISVKRITDGLDHLNVSMEDISALFITHEHIDHIRAIETLSSRYKIPIFATKGTISAIADSEKYGNINKMLFNTIKSGEYISIGNIEILPFHISHDAAEPVAFRFNSDGKACAIITDLGEFDQTIVEKTKNLDMVMIEANHDEKILEVGTYPYFLKQRILSSKGHLSNTDCGRFICKILNDKLKHIVLGHLSKENNMAELAYETVKAEIAMSNTEHINFDTNISVASDSLPTIIKL